MKSNLVVPTLRRDAWLIVLMQIIATMTLLGAGSVLQWPTLREYGIAFLLLGGVMIFLGTIKPPGGWRSLILGAEYLASRESSPFTLEMQIMGAINLLAGIVLIVLGLI